MAKWAVVVSPEQYESERLYSSGSLTVPGVALSAGDEALLIAATAEPVVFGLARADPTGALTYTVNLLDAPLPAGSLADGALPAGALRVGGLAVGGLLGGGLSVDAPGVRRLSAAAFGAATERIAARGDAEKRTWLVSVDLPIEASSPGEAVRAFWNYVRELGPAELPAFVWPVGDELSMQAFVLGAETNQDPEEE